MGWTKNKRALVKASITFFSLVIASAILVFATNVFAATHTSSASLEPEWSVPGAVNNYNVTFCKLTGNTVNEVRIYKNYDGSIPYTDFSCADKAGWEKLYIGTYPACFYVANESSLDYNPLNVDGECETFYFSATAPEEEPAECKLYWRFETRDDQDMYVTLYDTTSIDSEAPNTTKTYGAPFYSDGTYDWITTDTVITLNSVDLSLNCAIGVDKLYWRNTWLPNVPDEECIAECDFQGEGNWTEVDGSSTTFQKPEESCHLIEFYAVDKLGNTEEINRQCVFVDDTAPNGTKTVGEPNIPCVEGECDIFNFWVGGETTITLDCKDQLPHPVGQEEVCYKIGYDVNQADLTEKYCPEDTLESGEWCCVPVPEQIIFEEDSMHSLEYYCTDYLGNQNGNDLEHFKVDSTAPNITKTMIGDDHLGECPPKPGTDDVCYVADNGQNGVRIDVSDPDPTEMDCNVNQVQCKYWVLWGEGKDIEQCKIEGYNYYGDYLGTTWCLVEGGPQGGFGEEGKDVIFKEDSRHVLIVECQDALENEVLDIEEFLVDSTPPITTKTYGTPFVGAGDGRDWINSTTLITLNATDEKVGVEETKYRTLLLNDDKYCKNPGQNCYPDNYAQGAVGGDFLVYDDPFTIPESSCHAIEFYSVDKLGNTEITNWQCVYVDNTAPQVTKEVGDPKVPCEDGELCDYYINQQTPITLTCRDIEPHPVGIDDEDAFWYRYRYSDDCVNLEQSEWTAWIDPTHTKTIYFTEDSCHQLEYYCVDMLGNAAPVQSEIDIVDTQAPVITKTLEGPYYGTCPPQDADDVCFVDTATSIEIDFEDPLPHPVGDVVCEWRYQVNGGEWSNWSNILPITFPEESQHNLEIVCKDGLGNTVRDIETFYVDKTAPAIYKDYIGPYFSGEVEDYWAEWISSQTNVSVNVEDEGPHLSGIKDVKYRVSLINDEYCRQRYVVDMVPENGNGYYNCQGAEGTGEWIEVDAEDPEFEFNIDETSCHLIEIYAEDNVGKFSNHKQCVFVDNTAPEANKTVGEIKTLWDGADSTFYPNETAHCWDGTGEEIECWKVTLDTLITLDCSDPEPHPVNHEEACFMVGLDGVDATAEYCDQLDGNLGEDGYCCGFNVPYTFKFREESEHNLKFTCTDALGNKGIVDEEKFKVFGRMFEIPIYKKWNLISVPFDPINKSTEKVFSEINENVDSVVTYDSATNHWSIYRPDGVGPNDLEEIKSGWGYWVLATNDDTLWVGGSLFSPGPVVPPQKPVNPSWNLIGHYGTESDVAYCSLFSLVDTTIGYPRWSALWGYDELSDEFTSLNSGDYTIPGEGYWLEIDVPESYTPSTTCWGYY